MEFDLDELKEQLGIDSNLEKLIDLAAKFCSEKSRTEYSGQRLKIQSRLQKPPKGFLTSWPQFNLPSVFEETESFGPEVAEVIAQRVNDTCSKKAMDSKLKDLYEMYKTPANCILVCA